MQELNPTLINGKTFYKHADAAQILGTSTNNLAKNRAKERYGMYKIFCLWFNGEYFYEKKDLLTYLEVQKLLGRTKF